MKTAYLTGATGCIGRNLVEELLRDGWRITVLHRRSSDLSRLAGCNVKFQEVDLHDAQSTRTAVATPADALFHAAANTSHWPAEREQQYRDNVVSTRNLAQAALASGVKRFIFTTTGATMPYQGADESLTGKINNGYIRTKRLSELEIFKAADAGLDAVFIHPIIVIGKYDYNSYSQIFIDLKSGKMNAAFPGRIAFCHAADVARAHISAFARGRTLEGYVLGGEYTTWLDAFQRIARVAGAAVPTKVLSKPVLQAVSYLMWGGSVVTRRKPMLTPELVRLVGDAPDVSFSEKRKAEEVLGYHSRSLDEMIKDCHDWLVEIGRLN